MNFANFLEKMKKLQNLDFSGSKLRASEKSFLLSRPNTIELIYLGLKNK